MRFHRFVPFCALLAAVVLPAAGFAEDAGPDTAARLLAGEQPVFGKYRKAEGVEFRIGHFSLRFSTGTMAPMMLGDRQLGVYLEGEGTFSYNSVDPAEAAVLKTIVKSSSSLKQTPIDKGVQLSSKVSRVVLWTTPKGMPAGEGSTVVEGEPVAALDSKRDEHRKLFAKAWEAPPSHLYLQQMLDSPDSDYAYAELSTGSDRLVYRYDPLETRAEGLYSLLDLPFTLPYGARFPATLSEQVIDRDRRAFTPHRYLLTDVTYTLDAPMKGDAKLEITETIMPQFTAQRVFRFELFSAFYEDDGGARLVHLKKVQDEYGREIPFHHTRDTLVVALPEPAAANQAFKLKFSIQGDFLVRPGANSYWMMPVGPWFPMPGLNGQYYTAHSTLRVEKPFIGIAPGTTVSRVDEGDWNVVVNKIEKPVQFLCAVGGKYGIAEETRDGLTIRVASYGMRNKRAEKTQLNLARKLIGFYEPWLGPFPFDEFNIIEINELGWGQAPPGTMFITREAFTPLLNDIWSQGVNHRFAHEIAHQYWGHVVKMGSLEEQWITESFAEYSSSFAVKQLRGDSDYDKLRENWAGHAAISHDAASIPMSYRLLGTNKKACFDRRNLVYFKGSVLLQALHNDLGDKLFVSFMRNYQKGLEWRFGTTRDMITLLQKLNGKDYTRFFEEAFWGTEAVPKKIVHK